MNIRVMQHFFFKAPSGGTLHYLESCPPVVPVHAEHRDCNCTTTVAERPSGEPYQVRDAIVYKDRATLGDREVDIEFDLLSSWFKVYWDDEAVEKALDAMGVRRTDGGKNRASAYFIFGFTDDNRSNERRMRIQAPVPGYGHTGYFFGNVYQGRDIDTSRMMNGHSPSAIVNKTKLQADDLWVHECCWGSESMMVMPPSAETTMWRQIFDDVGNLYARARGLRITPTGSLEEQYTRINNDTGIRVLTGKIQTGLLDVLHRLTTTEVFIACDHVHAEAERTHEDKRAKDRS